MKRLVTILTVIGLLIGAAVYYSSRTEPEETPETTTTRAPVKDDDAPKELKPSTNAISEGTLTLSSSVSHGFLKQGAANDLYAAIDVKAKEVEGGTRPALNLAVVIDSSGSMNGDKIVNARRAAHQLVDSLSSRDRLAIVSYNNYSRVDMSSRVADTVGKQQMRAAIGRVSASGGTNIEAGLRAGAGQVSSASTDETVNRIILLSDGHPTVGRTSTSALAGQSSSLLSRGISTTTMGVGLDYNEDLMAAIANKGAGNYYFVDEPESAMAFFAKEFDGLAATVARNTSLVIKLPEGVELSKLYGFEHKRSGNRVMVPLAELYSEEEKNILVRLDAKGESAGELDVLDLSLSYDDVTREKPGHQMVTLTSVVTDDLEKLDTGINTDVIARVEQVEVAESMQAAMDAYKRGDRGQAQQVLRRQQTKMRRTKSKYNLPAKTQQKFDRVDKELDDTVGLFGSASSDSDEGKKMIKSKKARGRMILMEKSAF